MLKYNKDAAHQLTQQKHMFRRVLSQAKILIYFMHVTSQVAQAHF